MEGTKRHDAPAEEEGARWLVMRHPDLRRYLAARFVVSTAVQIQTVAVGWHIYTETGDPLHLGLVGLSQFLPFILLILPAGHVADQFDRRRVQLVTFSILALCAAALLALAVAGTRDPLPVFGVMAVFGAARAFNHPTGQALLVNVATPALFPRAVAVNASLLQVATIIGPALGGAIVIAGVAPAYAVTLAMLLVGVVLIAGLRAGGRGEAVREPVSWSSLLSGIRFVRGHPAVLGSISLDLFAVLFGGATALLPIYAGEILHAGPVGLGIMRAAPAVGAAVLAAAVATRPIRRHAGRWMFGGVAAFGLATLVFGVSTHLVVSVAALAVMGAGDMVSVYVRHLLVQLETPDEIRGRVSAVNAVFIGASNELGEFESGITASWWGIVPAVLVGGAATLAVAAAWTRLFPVLWRLDRFPGQRESSAHPG
ncbi:MAG TPA: MFS transporter [Candidatus Limnocylindria bacterium]|nr:MFS transporter [Candidatus Limnocylindria bacterium]